ncbi:dimethylarginine dimethylaminohydrolase family protein [Scopulibacillus cellulosilyticus]|uniref:Dimethylarginine dimethylaminohydrolase family protein n=1 Tax=Scopulibacillus cellulosilyticus TaxID=2665665 RepID=A0ABW2Q2Z1_9BACL
MAYGCQSMAGKIESILIKHPRDAFISQEHLEQHWKAYNYVSCPDYEKAIEEYKAFEAIIKGHIPNVHYLPRHSEVGLDSIYTHDAVKITKKGAILLKPGKALRQGEPAADKEYLNELGIPFLGEITGKGRVEGGDIVWIDERTLAVGRGYRTNDEGIRQLREIVSGLVDEFIVVPLPHGNGPDECLHLMSIISLVDNDLAVVYSEYMPVSFREWLIDRGIKFIEVPKEEYDHLGSNVLALAPRKCLILQGNPKTKVMLESAGAVVFEYPGDEISFKGTGGPTCLTCPIVRI